MHKKFAREGFTLIELTLSILFISVLSLAVALLIINAITAYRRGITLNQINDTGMELTDDMRASVQGAQARSLKAGCADFYSEDNDERIKCESDDAGNFSSIARYGEVENGSEKMLDVPMFGAFCSGLYSYIWNSGYFFSDSYVVQGGLGRASLKYRSAEGDEKEMKDFKLLKVLDENQEVCKSMVADKYEINNDELSGDFDISSDKYSVVEEEPKDILNGDILLAVYDLSIGITNESSVLNNSLYAVSFILGTESGGVNVKASGNYCAAPEDYEQSSIENFDYCAINKFNFVAQANGG